MFKTKHIWLLVMSLYGNLVDPQYCSFTNMYRWSLGVVTRNWCPLLQAFMNSRAAKLAYLGCQTQCSFGKVQGYVLKRINKFLTYL